MPRACPKSFIRTDAWGEKERPKNEAALAKSVLVQRGGDLNDRSCHQATLGNHWPAPIGLFVELFLLFVVATGAHQSFGV